MKRAVLKKLSETIERSMNTRGITAKELAVRSKIGYSTLIPILNGTRDFGVSKLVALANALHCSADEILQGLLSVKSKDFYGQEMVEQRVPPRYLVVFISLISVTYYIIYETKSKATKTSVLQFPLGCGQNPDEFLEHILLSLQNTIRHHFKSDVESNEVAVFTSVQQYEWATNREKIQKRGDDLFAKFIIESDVITNHRALLSHKNGILITVNDGNGITYSTDHGKNITKLQGYGFPISDVAGNFWIGCEAIKHAINVKENLEPSSLLADKILALYSDNLNRLSEDIVKEPGSTYLKASTLVRELINEDEKSYAIVKSSADLLLQKIKLLENQLNIKLSIVLTGDLAHLYKGFFPKERLIGFKEKHSDILLNYGINLLCKMTEPAGK